ncbi:hypothetical protein BFG04_02320 [Campylobacter pinnipediorum subsp. pinnipediorum]|uniref:DUF1561 domain protein n=1 Tax=Campylobacter pinnipediorum subsp. pinnipediorum TaxID=1660067 RepID=A0AAX0LBH9_9BACT|nr:DUF1561 family protein [Campylobacter pinnipediorum]OPA78880.1 hypothetical protein BFG04_02320 [Campylobacter pinnipediorum subsp. pinnipediorum]
MQFYNKVLFILHFFLLFSNAQDVRQVVADTPKDMILKVRTEDGQNLCYSPVFSKGESYIYLDYCSNKLSKARYDVFGRISFEVNGNYLCLVAPSSVTGIDGKSTQSWDYMHLSPCTLNDRNQRFMIKNSKIFTNEGNLRIKHYKYYAYISKKSSDKENHELHSEMKSWANLRAAPATLSFKTPIAWPFIDRFQWALYYLQNNKSVPDNIVELYYNSTNGHIAQYYKESGQLYCLTSNQKKTQNWNWVSWEECKDVVTKSDEKHKWSFLSPHENDSMIIDYLGNILRLSAYGVNWGVPYTIKPSYMPKDTSNAPKEYFTISHELGDWLRFVNANLADELNVCPASGKQTDSKTRVKRDIHPSFKLEDEAWQRRLWQIARSGSNNESEGIGICGTCLLQTMQMVLEILNDTSVRNDGEGYLFPTAHMRDPFIAFRQRYPGLSFVLETQGRFEESARYEWAQMQTALGHSALGLVGTFLSNYVITGTNMLNESQLDIGVQSVLRSSPGSVWINFIYTINPQTNELEGHIMPVIRTQNGMVYVTTNFPDISFEQFRQRLSRTINTTSDVRNRITNNGTLNLAYTQFIQVSRRYFNPIVLSVSQNNCTGEGPSRRGSKRKPEINLINQCDTPSKRCGLLESR